MSGSPSNNPQPAKSTRVILSYGDAGYITYDPQVAQAARAEDAARAARNKERLAEDHKVYAPWLPAVGRAIKKAAKSKVGRFFFGSWADTVFFTVALHTVPVLWAIDVFCRQRYKVTKKKQKELLLATLRTLYYSNWSDGQTMISDSGFFRVHRLAAVGVGTLVFLLSSPLLLLTLPLVAMAKIKDLISNRMYARKIRKMKGLR